MIMPLMTVSVHAGVWELHDPDWGTSYSTDPKYVYSGSRSAHLGFGDTSVNGWWTLSGTSASFGVEKHDSGKTYTLSFYFKCHEGTETNQYLEVAFGGQGWDGYVGQGWADSIVIEGNDFNAGTKEGIAAGGRFAKLELTDAGNGWKRLEYTPIVTEPGVNLFAVKAGTKTNMYIDDISIKDETGKELVKNGGFEIVGERVDYEPKNVLATAANANKMSISWRNPAAPALSKVSIYEVTGGKNELFGKSRAAHVLIVVGSGTNGHHGRNSGKSREPCFDNGSEMVKGFPALTEEIRALVFDFAAKVKVAVLIAFKVVHIEFPLSFVRKPRRPSPCKVVFGLTDEVLDELILFLSAFS